MTSSHQIQHTLNRINRILLGKRQMGHRDIRLGLDRIKRAVPDNQGWQGVHVGGTNGKGSICAFLGGLFKLAGIGYGSYISPAFPEKHNGVMINGQYVNPRQYETEAKIVQDKWDRIASGWQIHHGEEPETLSPFELETATAFRIFNTLRVPYGIVEVGMGGATDATNAMKDKAVTIISKIGLDHQEYLGNTVEKIAKVKAGIMRRNVPCIVDHTNQPSVIRVLREHAREVGTELILTWKAEPFLSSLDNSKWRLESYQIQNLLCAALAFRFMFPHQEINLDKLMAIDPFQPGRLEKIEILPEITGGESKNALVDGAHNLLGIQGLVGYVDDQVRQSNKPVTWVMGMSSSKTKPFDEIIETIVRPEDNLAFVEFSPAPNQPPPAPANFGSDCARKVIKNPEQIYGGKPELGSALKWASEKAGQNGPLVVTGSLYLIKDLYKMQGIKRAREIETRESTGPISERSPQPTQQNTSTEESFESSENETPVTPERLKARQERLEAVRQAKFHKKHAEGYRKLVSIIQKDIDIAKREQEVDEVLNNLGNQLEALSQQAKRHEESCRTIRRSPNYPRRKLSRFAKAQNPFRSGARLNPSHQENKPSSSSWGTSKAQQVAQQATSDQSKSPEQLDAEKEAMAKLEAERAKAKAAEKATKADSTKANEADPFATMKTSRREDKI